MKKNFISWQDVIDLGTEEVYVESYGYDEVHTFGTHFEPFSELRTFTFTVERPIYETSYESEDCWLSHDWLNLVESESNLDFELREDGKVYLYDPELFSKE